MIAPSRSDGREHNAFSPARRAAIGWLLGLALLPAPGAASLCLQVETAGRVVATIPVTPGSELRLAFRHSIYGATVEELFEVRGNKLQLYRLLYAEPRLAEFYGYEGARHENGSWVVLPERRTLAAIHIHVSPDSFLELSLDSRPIPLRELVEPGGAAGLAVASCAGESDGR